MSVDPVERRLEQLEDRVRRLEQAAEDPPGPGDGDAKTARTPSYDPETFWVLDGLTTRMPGVGAVIYAGQLETADGPVAWQYGAGTDGLLEQSWDAHGSRLAALGSPVRLEILRAVLRGANTVTDLVEAVGSGTTGQIYHHVHQLTAAGWLVTEARGRYAVPADRTVPLLTILTAAGGVR